VETSTREIGVGKAEGRRSERRGGKRIKERNKKRENNGGKESGRRMGDLGRRGRSGKIGEGSEEVGA